MSHQMSDQIFHQNISSKFLVKMRHQNVSSCGLIKWSWGYFFVSFSKLPIKKSHQKSYPKVSLKLCLKILIKKSYHKVSSKTLIKNFIKSLIKKAHQTVSSNIFIKKSHPSKNLIKSIIKILIKKSHKKDSYNCLRQICHQNVSLSCIKKSHQNVCTIWTFPLKICPNWLRRGAESGLQ